MAKDKERIVALQKQLKIAREALSKAASGALSMYAAEMAIDEMNALEWASKPNLVQDRWFLGRNVFRR